MLFHHQRQKDHPANYPCKYVHRTAYSCAVNVVKALCNAGSDLLAHNSSVSDLATPLHKAVEGRHPAVAWALSQLVRLLGDSGRGGDARARNLQSRRKAQASVEDHVTQATTGASALCAVCSSLAVTKGNSCSSERGQTSQCNARQRTGSSNQQRQHKNA